MKVSCLLILSLLVSVFVAGFNFQPAKFVAGSHAGPVQAADSVDWWPMFHHDSTHTGYSTSSAPTTNETLWATYIYPWYVWTSPAVAGGVVYVSSFDHYVYAFGPSNAVPEFPSFLILPLFVMATLLAAVVFRKKY